MLQVINPIKNALQQGWKNLPKKRIASFVGMFIFCAMATYASSKGAGGFTKATTEISSYQTSHRRRHRACRLVQRLFQDAER